MQVSLGLARRSLFEFCAELLRLVCVPGHVHLRKTRGAIGQQFGISRRLARLHLPFRLFEFHQGFFSWGTPALSRSQCLFEVGLRQSS